jgi:pteridine reductase
MMRSTVLITGAARRVGRAIALHLARQGYDVAFTYHSSSAEAASLVEELKSLGAAAWPIQADFADLRCIWTIESEMARREVTLAGIINNASIYLPDDPADAGLSTRMWRVHVEVPLALARGFAPQLKGSQGCIINLCDILGEKPMPGWLAYCASKAALANLTLGLARELAPEVRVNGIAPGVVEWPADYPEEQKSLYLKRVPLQRSGTPEDVALLVHFLLTGGSYITGQILRLDGGRSIA